jgi:cyclopropane fatty-acyl-phospholipid synthase-like methyltransferase
MREVNLLDRYPRVQRNITAREAARPAQRAIARQFGLEYFDGERGQGYGGYRYDGRWLAIAERMRDYYGLKPGDAILEVGCAKGFLLHDFRQAIPGVRVAGLDISPYAVKHAMDDVKAVLAVGSAEALPFAGRSFDLVISINTIHNLGLDACRRAIREMERVSRRFKYLQVDSYRNDEEREKFERWQLTALTHFAPDGWRTIFGEVGYTGDYYWTITE